ncbi:MAG: flavodoxin [Selenomonadaceae bacterium]|nr:flavodoxin [Selenomonadaceae bacterium]
MKRFFTLTFTLAIMFLVTACGNVAQKPVVNTETPEQTTTESSAQTTTEPAAQDTKETSKDTPTKKNLIVYFSRTGDNYEVGNIEKGNTKIVADIIAENVDADVFEIKPETAYPAEYKECTKVAKSEKENNSRPKFVGQIENFANYETIYLGTPVWWGDLPMVVYTFLESYDFNGKKIIPFCTSANDHFVLKESIEKAAKGATVLEGLGIRGKRCQENPDSVKTDVTDWLKKVNG